MRKIIILLSLIFFQQPFILQAQEIEQEEFEQYMLSVKDLDNDQINDTVYFDYKNSVVVCKLSSQNFKPKKSQTIEHYVVVRDTEDGFCLNFGSFLGGYNNKFRYETETKKVRLIEIYESVSVIGHQYGTSNINMLTNEYTGNWTYYEDNDGGFTTIEMPIIKTIIPFPKIYLEDFGENICYEYSEKSIKLFNFHKEKHIKSDRRY